MIRIVMLGRHGNNLFQYALGRVLAEKHGVPFIMDGSWYNQEGWNQVKCIKLLPGPAAAKVKIVRRCSLAARVFLKVTGKHYWEYRGVPILRENVHDQTYDSQFMNAPSDCMLFGYFQSPHYFSGFEDRLREELSTHDLGLENGHEALVERLQYPGSIAIHVRRSDYEGNPNLDLCGVNYYRTAMERMRGCVDGVRFFVFSDDIAWCRNNFNDPDIEFVCHDTYSLPLTDLHLMSLANHHIIANSSYSWWAAWLGFKDGQKVLMPNKWFGKTIAPVEEKRLPHWNIVQ